MPLKCQLFTRPKPDPRLEACLVRDDAHITPGAIGDHVKLIQIALNQLSNVFLKIDGIYGPKTAAAVQAYKAAPRRDIRRPGQKVADNIVGKRTIKSLDDEMEILENTLPAGSELVSLDSAGAPHDHNTCPTRPRVTGNEFLGHADHKATPINPQGFGRMINIFGEGETDYLGFEDFSTQVEFLQGRKLTSTLPDQSVSDICMRFSPIDAPITRSEIKRVAMLGCRFTFAVANDFVVFHELRFLQSLGPIIEQVTFFTGNEADDKTPTTAVVVLMLNHLR
jgi:hypothetical protein